MEIIDEITGLRVPTSEEKNVAMFTHLASFASLLMPLGNIIGPLIVWSLKKNNSEFVDANGKESLNYEITYTIIVLMAAGISAFFAISAGINENTEGLVLSILAFVFPVIGYWILSTILVIIAAVKASNGEIFHYPLSIRFIK
jgi:uncharacterized Tic20 family protein